MPPDTLENVRCWYSRLLYSNPLANSIFIETSDFVSSTDSFIMLDAKLLKPDLEL